MKNVLSHTRDALLPFERFSTSFWLSNSTNTQAQHTTMSSRNQTNAQGGATSRAGNNSSRNTNSSRQQNSTLEIRNGHQSNSGNNTKNNQRQQGGAQSSTAVTRAGAAGAGAGATSATAGTIAQQQEAWIKGRQVYQQQLLTEHFGFSPLSFVDDVINSVNNMIYQASMALQEFVENEMEVWAIQNQNRLPNDYDAKVESAKVCSRSIWIMCVQNY